jgi:hypothetical protein
VVSFVPRLCQSSRHSGCVDQSGKMSSLLGKNILSLSDRVHVFYKRRICYFEVLFRYCAPVF